ncbi:MAG: lytic transglycosylase domain-containing protein [Thermomonas sp.]|uniref:lytic transglycosylase domain-containing protein n=1 Tax=Thermomonas sp. TaxID=1971895 RepID=UPI0026086053|nr:lytic transglycosylase domain-containing protein [Thermomonas sp.]MCC7097126.1 lytic transglycosylase domain-containing protein [Thermomonas sp.]
MHTLTSLLIVILLGGTAALPACAKPAPDQAPLVQARAPIRIATPDPALDAAFDAAERSGLNDLALAGFRSQPLAGWLEYVTLKRQIDTLPVIRGNAFLATQSGTPVAAMFRSDWLKVLAKRNQWQEFLAQWDPGIDDANLRCLRLQALMAVNRTDANWVQEAQALWRSSGKSLPNSCDSPFALLAAQGGLTDALRWERFDLAADATQSAVMRMIGRGLPATDAAQANLWAAYIDAPNGRVEGWPKSARSRLVAAAALERLARNSPSGAEALLPGIAKTLGFTDVERGRVLAQVALQSAASFAPEAARRLAAVPDAGFDANLHEWQVRDAIARSDWAGALAAIRRMPDAQRNDSRWLYFAARTSALTGDAAGAKTLYARAARNADFYGFLAADRLDQPYHVCPLQSTATQANKLAIARDPGMVRALQLYMLGRKAWAVKEWNAALARFSDAQRWLAVEVAQDNGWFDRGVFGLVNVGGKRYPDEQRLYQLRFPLHHDATIRREALRNNLDPAWVAAEIRAESIFDPRARSSADARGLMQVLPSTGATLARRLGVPLANADALYDADTNITLGTAYLRQLLGRFNGKPYLVIAGYNAGPGAANRWLTQRPTLDPDFWIETIGYKETREYVARVLGFSTLYDWRLNGNALRISDRMLGINNGPRKGFACAAVPPPAAAPLPARR